MTQDQKSDITKFLNNGYLKNSESYIHTLFDPQQTHAMYKLNSNTLEDAKTYLKSIGAKKFRTVTADKKSDLKILCFDASNIKIK